MRGRLLLLWSGVLAALVTVSSVAGLVDPRVYEQETQNWTLQAQGQDLGNLLAVVVLVVAAVRAAQGSARAALVWVGTLLYLAYAFVVYAFAVHLNHLFLVYAAVLGLSAWALLLGTGEVRRRVTTTAAGRARVAGAWVLIATGGLFAVLWLGELVPALLAGEVPASVVEAGLWVNPIHVIDLTVVLPAFVATGVAALRRGDAGLFWLGPWLVFSALMGSSIVAAMLLILADGDASAAGPLVMVAVVVLASLGAAVGYLRSVGAATEVRVPAPPFNPTKDSMRV